MTSWTAPRGDGDRPDPYQPGRLTRFFLWCGGSDPTLLVTRVEFYRAAGVGGFIVLIALLGAVTFTLYASVVAGRFQPWFVLAAIGWGVIIFWVDRSIVVDPSYGDLRRAERSVRARVPGVVAPWPPEASAGGPRHQVGRRDSGVVMRPFMYLARLGMAVIVAVLISEVVVLLVFQPEIRKELAEQARLEYDQAIVLLGTGAAAGLTPTIERYHQMIKDNEAKVIEAKTNADNAFTRYEQEVSGSGGSGRRGEGPLARRLYATYERLLAEYHRVRDTQERANAGLQQAISEQVRRQQDLVTPGTSAFQELKTTDEAHRMAAGLGLVDGWLAQERAFRAFQDKHRDDFIVVWFPWLLRVLLILIDLLPLSLKVITGNTLYGRRLRDRAERIRYADTAMHLRQLDDIDHAVDLHGYRTGLATRLRFEGERRYLDHRIDHLRRDTPHPREQE